MNDFKKEVAKRIKLNPKKVKLVKSVKNFLLSSTEAKYSYNYLALGRPIIQYPQDMIAIQEIIWKVKPDLIIETGIAHGGSLIMSAFMLSLLDICEAIELGKKISPKNSSEFLSLFAFDSNLWLITYNWQVRMNQGLVKK